MRVIDQEVRSKWENYKVFKEELLLLRFKRGDNLFNGVPDDEGDARRENDLKEKVSSLFKSLKSFFQKLPQIPSNFTFADTSTTTSTIASTTSSTKCIPTRSISRKVTSGEVDISKWLKEACESVENANKSPPPPPPHSAKMEPETHLTTFPTATQFPRPPIPIIPIATFQNTKPILFPAPPNLISNIPTSLKFPSPSSSIIPITTFASIPSSSTTIPTITVLIPTPLPLPSPLEPAPHITNPRHPQSQFKIESHQPMEGPPPPPPRPILFREEVSSGSASECEISLDASDVTFESDWGVSPAV